MSDPRYFGIKARSSTTGIIHIATQQVSVDGRYRTLCGNRLDLLTYDWREEGDRPCELCAKRGLVLRVAEQVLDGAER